MPDGAEVGRNASGALLTVPNVITFGRLCAVPLAFWLVIDQHPAYAFFLFVAAGISDAVDGWLARRWGGNMVGALLDPVADKALLVSVYVTLGLAHQLWTSLVILVVFRDVMIVGGFLLIQAFAVPKHYDPLYISKINTGLQIALVAFVLARLGLAAASGRIDIGLSCAVIATTVLSGLSYLIRWARILARSEQAW